MKHLTGHYSKSYSN